MITLGEFGYFYYSQLYKIHLDIPICQNAKIVKTGALDGAQGVRPHLKPSSQRRNSEKYQRHNEIFRDPGRGCY